MTEREDTAPKTFEQIRADLRATYTEEINRVMDDCLTALVLPADKASIALDAAQFVVFMLTLKTVEASGDVLNKTSLLAAYFSIQKHIIKELPAMILELARSIEAQQGKTA